jgi:hypothetical protein
MSRPMLPSMVENYQRLTMKCYVFPVRKGIAYMGVRANANPYEPGKAGVRRLSIGLWWQ